MSLVRTKMKKVFYVLFVLSISMLLVNALISNKSVKVDAASQLNDTYDVITNFDAPTNNLVVDKQESSTRFAGWIATSNAKAAYAYLYDSTIYDLSNFTFDANTVNDTSRIYSDVYTGTGNVAAKYQMVNLKVSDNHAVINGVSQGVYGTAIIGACDPHFTQHQTKTEQAWGFDISFATYDTAIKIHNFKVVLVTGADDGYKVIEAKGVTVVSKQSSDYSNVAYTENKVINVISDNFNEREIRGCDGDVNGGAFGATQWNMALGSFVTKDTYLIATGEYDGYYRVKYAGYNSLDNEGFVLKTACQEITEGVNIATLTKNTVALNQEGETLFNLKTNEKFVMTGRDAENNRLAFSYAYSYKNTETNRLDWASRTVYVAADEVSMNVNYTVSDSVDGIGGTTEVSATTVQHGTSVTFTATPSEHYLFDGWYNGTVKVSSDAVYSVTVANDLSLAAKFNIETYSINVTATEGGTAVPSANTVDYSSDVTLTATANEGYTFTGWYNGDTLVSSDAAYTVSNVKANIDYTAKFVIKTFNIKVTTTEGGTAVPSANTVNYNTNVTLTATTSESHTFTGWYNGDTLVSSDAVYSVSNVKANIDYTAKFTIKTFNIKVTATEGGTATPSVNTVNYNTNVKLTATANKGYTFSGWYNGETLVSSDAEYTINNVKADVYYTAKYTKNSGCNSSNDSIIGLIIILAGFSILFLKKKIRV